MTGHDEHEKNNSKYLDNNDDLLCPVTYCAPVSPSYEGAEIQKAHKEAFNLFSQDFDLLFIVYY